MDLSKKLSFLVSSDSSFENPFDDNNPIEDEIPEVHQKEEDEEEITLESLSIDYYLNKSKEKKSKKKNYKKEFLMEDLDEIDPPEIKRRKSSYETSMDASIERLTAASQRLSETSIMDIADDFDTFLNDDELESDNNLELQGSLISLGRKYARETAVSAETSEIMKTFAGSEKNLKTLYDEISKDKQQVQSDIDQMRLARSRNFKSLSDLISAKNQYHATQLSIIKEINNIHKTQFDLKYKDQKNKVEEADSTVSNNTIRSLFSLGKGDLIGSIGGYEEISGARDDESYYGDEISDEEIQRKYFSDDEYNTDGDNYLKYEGVALDYILLLDSDNQMQDIIVEDIDGNLIPDYPMPSNKEELTFTIDAKTMTAEDGLHRKYKIRYV